MNRDGEKYNIAEKIGFAIGLLVSVALVGYLVFQISQKKKIPPQLQVSSSYKAALEPYTFQIRVENKGEETAKSVNLRFSLYQNGQSVETASMSIDYVPVKSSEIGWVVFYRERKQGDSLVVSSITFLKP